MTEPMILPEEFYSIMDKQIGAFEAGLLKKALTSDAPVSVRTNPFKNHSFSGQNRVPWCDHGIYLDKRPVFTLDPEFHAGSYYVQEASSMFLWHILKSLDLSKEINILDLCAAPGGKATLAATWLGGKGMLMANEVVRSRANVLKYNIMKEGHSNVLVTSAQPADLARLGPVFDIVICDAPCSGEGMFRKDPEAISHWSVQNVAACAIRQRSVVGDILPALKHGGHLIYSTCTFNNEENIHNADYFAREFGLENVSVQIQDSWGITPVVGKKITGYQFFPHRVSGEGFFCAVMQKTSAADNAARNLRSKVPGLVALQGKASEILSSWIEGEGMVCFEGNDGNIHAVPQSGFELAESVFRNKIYMLYAGITAGKLTKNVFIPDHSLALSNNLSHDVPRTVLSKEEALLYLKKELKSVDSGLKGWSVATFNKNSIGFLKNLGDRINNYLPVEYRILMDLPGKAL